MSPERVERIVGSALGIALGLAFVSPPGEVAGNGRTRGAIQVAPRTRTARTTAGGAAGALPPIVSRVTERALSLSWNGYAETDFDARRLNRDHTLSVRFMAAYEAAFRGVLVTDGSGNYRVGLAPYATLGRPAIEVVVGGTAFTHPLAEPVLTDNDFRNGVPRQPLCRWRQLVVSVQGRRVSVVLDSAPVGTFNAGARAPTGSLRFGRLAKPGEVQDQFYGFVDDIALFEPALSADELQTLTAQPSLSIRAPKLVATWLFNDAENRAGPKEEPFRLLDSAKLSEVSESRDNAVDSARLPKPHHHTRLSLPFAAGQTWLLIQGMNSSLSHNDSAAFALDFLRVDPALASNNPTRLPGGSHAASAGAPFVAVSDGTVVSRVDCFPNDNVGLCPQPGGARSARRAAPGDPANRNLICLEHQAGEVSCILHLGNGSARPTLGARVARGTELGEVGTTGARSVHLHFALSDRAEPNDPGTFSPLTTFPVSFSDYEASNDFGANWQYVAEGVPLPGQWLRRTEPPHAH
ncbi:MAG TPA: peptidoglycan DD-metalloendopeptidase family protein [Polyangiaceae bacterium]|nr:peptidoglycan DD-metalloendopeptidase family protein [Polyangiaceae bacterium]